MAGVSALFNPPCIKNMCVIGQFEGVILIKIVCCLSLSSYRRVVMPIKCEVTSVTGLKN